MLLNRLVQKAKEIEESISRELSQNSMQPTRPLSAQRPHSQVDLRPDDPPIVINRNAMTPSPTKQVEMTINDDLQKQEENLSLDAEVTTNAPPVEKSLSTEAPPPPLPSRTKSQLEDDEVKKLKRKVEELTFKLSCRNEEITSLASMNSELTSKLKQSGPTSATTDTPRDTSTDTQPVIVSDRLKELEKNNFLLEEQVRDLTIQVKSKQLEAENVQQTYHNIKSENEKIVAQHEEKMKKVKQLFAAAQKSSNEQKEQIQQKEELIVKKEEEFKVVKTRLDVLEAENLELKSKVDTITSKLSESDAISSVKLDDLQRALDRKSTELSTTISEFQAYKVRAYALLNEKKDDSANSKLAELEAEIHRLESEKLDLERTNSDFRLKVKELEELVKSSFDQVTSMESQLSTLSRDRKISEEKVTTLTSQLETERLEFAEKIKEKNDELIRGVRNVKEEMELENHERTTKLAEKENEVASLQTILENVSSELSSSRTEVFRLRDELSKANEELLNVRRTIQEDSNVLRGSKHGSAEGLNPSPQLVSLDELFKESTDQKLTSKEYELQIQQLTEMLEESETTVERLLDQEKMLKEEIRKCDRMDQRQYVNMEYLKNIVMKFLEAPSEPLVPVISQVLHLDPSEANAMKEAIRKKNTLFW